MYIHARIICYTIVHVLINYLTIIDITNSEEYVIYKHI